MVKTTNTKHFIINPSMYDELSYLELKEKLKWSKGKLVRACHELSNVEDIIKLNENPPSSVIHTKFQLMNDIQNLAAKVKILKVRINRMEAI